MPFILFHKKVYPLYHSEVTHYMKQELFFATSSKKIMPADQISQLAPPAPHSGGA